MANNQRSKADPEEARRLYWIGLNHDQIADKLGVSSSTVGRYINGGSRTNEYHRLVALLDQAYGFSVVAEDLTGHPFPTDDLDEIGDWDERLARLARSIRHLQKHLRTLNDTEGNTTP